MSWLSRSSVRRAAFSAALVTAVLPGCWERTDESPGATAPGRVLDISGPAKVAAPLASPAATPALAAPPAPPAPPDANPSLVVVAGGDVNFGRECGQSILSDPKYDPFAKIAPLWADADLRFVNLESQLSDQGGETQSPRNRLIFTGPPGGADVLSRAKVHVVSTANNHAWDYGRKALFETLANLERAGVANVGTGRNLAEAYRPAIFKLKGWSVAIFAVTHIWNYGPITDHEGQKHVAWARFDRLKAEFAKARRENDVVLVSYHGGEEYIDAPVTRARDFVKTMMRAGADAFIGHHPHVPQGVGWTKQKPVFYSLGNFVFAGHNDKPWTKFGFLAKLVFSRSGADQAAGIEVDVFACPYRLEGHVPLPLTGPDEAAASQSFHKHLRLISTSTGGSELGEPDELGCFRISPPQRAEKKSSRVASAATPGSL